MTTVHVLIAEHFSVPGTIIGVHASHEGAVKEAVSCVNVMLGDSSVDHPAATIETWEDALLALQDYHGAQYCSVEIIEKKLAA